jgi:hypothetical protein
LAILDTPRFPGTIGGDWASIGNRRIKHSGRASVEFDCRVFSLLSLNNGGVSSGLDGATKDVFLLVRGVVKDPFFLCLVPAESHLEEPCSEPNSKLLSSHLWTSELEPMDPIVSNDSSPRMQSHEFTDRLSAATALYTNLKSCEGRWALSSTMCKSEAVIDLL